MEFRTNVSITDKIPQINHQDSILLLGSCFAESIGKQLVDYKFNCNINPFGILYNPFSIAQALRQIMNGGLYTTDDLFYYSGKYHSYMHHGSFSNPEADQCLLKINSRLNDAHLQFPRLSYLFITLGSAWIYTLNSSEQIVSNCHKVPAKQFARRRLSISEIVHTYKELIKSISAVNKEIKIIFTVSPIRHIKDGLHENQLSKSTLLLAVDEIQKDFPEQVYYFPTYELLMDDLRDYRFYADDMLHPSDKAIQYIWERFSEKLFSDETKNGLKEYESIHRDINHKPFYPGSDEHKRFLEQIVLKINQLKGKYPNFDVEKELQICLTQLK